MYMSIIVSNTTNAARPQETEQLVALRARLIQRRIQTESAEHFDITKAPREKQSAHPCQVHVTQLLCCGPSMPCCSSSTGADSTRPFPSSIDLPCVSLIGTSHQGWVWALDDDTICDTLLLVALRASAEVVVCDNVLQLGSSYVHSSFLRQFTHCRISERVSC